MTNINTTDSKSIASLIALPVQVGKQTDDLWWPIVTQDNQVLALTATEDLATILAGLINRQD